MDTDKPLTPVAEWLKNHVCTPRGGIPLDYTHRKFAEEMGEFAKRGRGSRPRRTM